MVGFEMCSNEQESYQSWRSKYVQCMERRQLDVSGLSKELFAEHGRKSSKHKDVKEENISFQIPSIFVQEPGKLKYRKRFLNHILQKYEASFLISFITRMPF